MKRFIFLFLVTVICLQNVSAFAQAKEDTTAALGLAGDNLDLYAVLDLFQKSKTIEAFEKSLNDEKEKINNLDLNLDKKVDFIKVVTKKDGDSYTFILQVDVAKKETQDVAVILLDKGKDNKVSLQIVGDEELYGKDYVIEPKGNSSVTANPGYKGSDPVTVNVPATTTVVVQQAPIVQYVYSPAYVPYYPPYYYGYYPPWFGFATVMAVGIYRSNHYYHHGGYYGGHYGGGNTVIVNNRNSINHYNNSRNTSNTVRNNQNRGSYGNGSTNRRGGTSASNRASNNMSSNRAGNNMSSNRAGNNPSVSNRQSPSTSNRQSPSTSNRQSPSMSNRQSPSATTRQSSGYSSPSSRSGSMGGGGRSMGGGGGRSMGGGGGRRR
ncbi:hypothetical protein C3K47_01600 [Solitalea longa]|uniref:DUF3300 domain-containing protein n=1 Tax=Solitalea longa TaxID=2079460 RepID=A0A2S5A9I6_9SPHI|nr:hypothetical protein [Solitalea longa]POY39215.1 hypothetical protein C3K47_01600 [Solitalea longa]